MGKAFAYTFLVVFVAIMVGLHFVIDFMGWQYALGVMTGGLLYYLGYLAKTGEPY